MLITKTRLKIFLLILIASGICRAQFLDSFNKNKIEGWFFFTGDGAAKMDFVQMNGYARILIDATKDKHNVYWTLIKRDVTDFLDLYNLKYTSFQLRVEAKVRIHNAPRGLNMMVNTIRTTNYHIDLMEFDIPDTTDWHVKDREGIKSLLILNADQWAILRWDFEKYKNLKINGQGLLELTTYSVLKGGDYMDAYGEDFGIEFGRIRENEIIGGDPEWDQNKVTYNNFISGKEYSDVFNTKMIFDAEMSEEQGGKNFITISKPVLQRILEGKTKGLLIVL